MITEADGQRDLPSTTAQKIASFSLSFRPQSQVKEGGVKIGSRLVAVELAQRDRNRHAGEASALQVVLSSGRRIAVPQQFDSATLGRLVKVLEGL